MADENFELMSYCNVCPEVENTLIRVVMLEPNAV